MGNPQSSAGKAPASRPTWANLGPKMGWKVLVCHSGYQRRYRLSWLIGPLPLSGAEGREPLPSVRRHQSGL